MKKTILFLLLLPNAVSAQIDRSQLDSLLSLDEYQNAIVVRIEHRKDRFQGSFEDLRVFLERSPVAISRFDLRFIVAPSQLRFQEVIRGELTKNKHEWTLTDYYEDNPTNGLREIQVKGYGRSASGETVAISPSSVPNTLLCLRLLTSNDRTLEGQDLPVSFSWSNTSNNSFQTEDGRAGLANCRLYRYDESELDLSEYGYFRPTDLNDSSKDETAGIPLILVNGAVSLNKSWIDDPSGDINLNGIDYELEDLTMFAQYFADGIKAFEPHVAGSVAGSDVNRDGKTLTLADFSGFLTIICGLQPPYLKLSQHKDTASVQLNRSNGNIAISFTEPLAAVFLRFKGKVTPELLEEDLEMVWSQREDTTRVLIYQKPEPTKDQPEAQTGQVLKVSPPSVPIEAEAATFEGTKVATKVQ